MPKALSKEMGDGVTMPAAPGSDADARRFYGQLLGLKETMKPPGEKGVWFVVPLRGHDERPDAAASGRIQRDTGLFKLVPKPDHKPAQDKPQARFRVDKAEAMRMALDKARFRHYDAPAEEGTRGFYALDPFGNKIELRERAG